MWQSGKIGLVRLDGLEVLMVPQVCLACCMHMWDDYSQYPKLEDIDDGGFIGRGFKKGNILG